ncbi:MAG TPA: thioredoxin domain-containing protein [Gemmatimonadales bacterium]|nr:thioredoxin domain-containing protein [Gemmatimonadales bacterium]
MPNALAAAPSAYLQSAAHQPVQWLPWGDAPFARARAERKPVLLDIGAVWCHWCHVMDRESYEDPRVAEILNRDFVCIKVDRDERPDVDVRYQRAVQALTGQGGWPLTAFLTPEGEVFFGGTYFPPEENPYGRPGFRSVLAEIARLYREDPSKVRGNASAIRKHVVEALDEAKPGAVDGAVLAAAADQMARLFDVRYGGFGGAPKFPHPAACRFLIARWRDGGPDWQREIAEKTLLGMANGGVRDHLGGGFHRYSVDERWVVPHFEKMAYDNAELLHAYLDGYAAFGTPVLRDVANGVVDWVLEILSDREAGLFFASQDADAGPDDDGDYWTWTVDEAKAALAPREFEIAARVFDIDAVGEMHHNPAKNVLWRRRDPAGDDEWPILQDAMRKLKAARDRRPPPFVDRTAYTGWSAMLASAFLDAGAVLDRPECNTLALKALERIATEAWDERAGFRHVVDRDSPRGFLEDHVHAASAFLDAYEATGVAAWLERAIGVMRYGDRAFADAKLGGYFDLAADATGPAYLADRAKPVQDAPTPSGNGVAGLVLARLAALTGDPSWRERLDRALRATGGGAADLGLHGATLLRAADWARGDGTRIEVAGPRGDGPACAMHLLALQTYRPRKVVIRKEAGRAAATVCVGTTCSLPVATPDALRDLLA